MLLWLPAYLDHFALGMALAVISVAGERDGRTPLAWVDPVALGALARRAAAFAVVAVGIGLSPENRIDAPMDAAQTVARHWLYAAVAVGVAAPGRVRAAGPRRDPAAAGAPGAALPRRDLVRHLPVA